MLFSISNRFKIFNLLNLKKLECSKRLLIQSKRAWKIAREILEDLKWSMVITLFTYSTVNTSAGHIALSWIKEWAQGVMVKLVTTAWTHLKVYTISGSSDVETAPWEVWTFARSALMIIIIMSIDIHHYEMGFWGFGVYLSNLSIYIYMYKYTYML